jgi:hypothetical protein
MKNRKQEYLINNKQEDKVMKTINSKLRKAGIESLTVLAIIFATCFTISAQGAFFEDSFNSNEELASLETIKTANRATRSNESSVEIEYFAEFLIDENESDLTVESWMTDATFFGVAEMETEIEEVLKVEDWMLDEALFKTEETEKKKEEPVTVKIDKKAKTIGVTFPGAQFGRRTFIHIEMEDPKLELEQWMVDERVWIKRR